MGRVKRTARTRTKSYTRTGRPLARMSARNRYPKS